MVTAFTTYTERRSLASAFVGSLLIFLLFSNGAAQGYVDILPDEVKNPYYERHERIVKDISKLPENEWVGVYSLEVGETWSERLFWAPQSGFAAFRDTCSSGPRAWVNYGTASFNAGVLTLTPERLSDASFLLELPSTQFTPLKWDRQHWLVPTDKFALFAYAINSGSGQEYEIAYLKAADTDLRRKGRPNLPGAYKGLLGLPPIKATVISVGKGPNKWYPPMVINAGKDRGVIEEMYFWLVGEKGIVVRVEVTEVGERTSTVSMSVVGHSGDSDTQVVPRTGWRFSSRAPNP